MSADAALARLAELNGIFPEFTDMQGVVHRATPDTQRALLRANGLDVGSERRVADLLGAAEAGLRAAYLGAEVVVVSEQACSLAVAAPVEWQVLSEERAESLAAGRAEDRIDLPPLPDGVHMLRLTGARGEQKALLIAAPARVPDLRDVTGQGRTWGVMAALYGLKTQPRKTLADFRDLAEFSTALGGVGAGFVGINPVHALGGAGTQISPYSPTHRGFLGADHIALPGMRGPEAQGGLLDYRAHRAWHREALATAYATFREAAPPAERQEFAKFCSTGGLQLRDFARFEALSEIHGPDSRAWPAEADALTIDPERIDFHCWLQWQADRQLGSAQDAARQSGMALGLYLDLAVGARLGGAETWGEAAATADGVSLGAPPDQLSPAGQNWQLAALSPRRLRTGRYEAFRFVLRQNMRHCGLLRIDHALGLNRSFWLPEDGAPGGYIRQPFQALMAIIALEARRSGTVIVGEDLGLVPGGFRREMGERGLYGYSVLQYEKDASGNLLPAEGLRAGSLACFGTHDTPTLEGFWQGRDIAWWEKLGWITPAEAARAVDRRSPEKRQLAHLPAPQPLPRSTAGGVRDSVHDDLARSPAALVAVQLDDILCLEEAQNLPGTVDEHPNWRRVYPETIAQIGSGADLKKTAAIMDRAGRGSLKRKETS